MDSWLQIYKNVSEIIGIIGSDIVYFRGHADARWKLLPGLARLALNNPNLTEQISYFDFITRAGFLLPENGSSWNHLFQMQHHGIPTRLLDWTENFAVALYFSMLGATGDSCIWILNPFGLNENESMDGQLLHPKHLPHSYEDYFIENIKPFNHHSLAVAPLRHSSRIFNQKSGFTLHGDLVVPLEEKYPDLVTKITIPVDAHQGARDFLKMAGVSEFSMFPDLDGLAREIKNDHFSAT